MHRALVSLREELEAVDWYQQRAEACSDTDLAAVLTHNKNEEIEHAMMTLEWIRRHSPVVDKNLEVYLNTTGPITEVEKTAMGGGGGGEASGGAARRPVGDLRWRSRLRRAVRQTRLRGAGRPRAYRQSAR